ncbi:MAG: hypothetical protein ABRQ24_06390 [Syntrophomonadaceae bacterium]
MGDFIERVRKAASKYTVMDFGCLKIAVLCAGILLGVYFPVFFSGYTTLLWIILILSWLWIMFRTFIKYIR